MFIQVSLLIVQKPFGDNFIYFLSRTSNNQILNALLDLKSDVTLTLGYCNPALNHQALYVTQCLSTY